MSASKRRAGGPASPEMATPDLSKRQKRTNDTNFPDGDETPAGTTEVGIRLMKQLRNSRDKTGRNVATHFLTLPDKDKYPQYYQQVKLPIAMETIEGKLERYEYPNMEALESDLKRLVQNAKEFNSTKSEVYEDAERIRKALSNFMPKHNPAYLNPAYRAYPTPVPRDANNSQLAVDQVPSTPVNGNSDLKHSATNVTGARKKRRASTMGDDTSDGADLISEQVEILNEMMALPNSENFLEKPSKRHYPDYYRTIARPTALIDIQKKAQKGEFQAWDNFMEEVRLIWSNAKDYNEEDSQIYMYAEELEKWFEEHMAQKGVAPAKKLKLTMPHPEPKLTLKLRNRSSVSTPPFHIDNEALRRQTEDINKANAVSRRGSSKIPFANANVAPASIQAAVVDSTEKRSSESVTPPVIPPGPTTEEKVAEEDLIEVAVDSGKLVEIQEEQQPTPLDSTVTIMQRQSTMTPHPTNGTLPPKATPVQTSTSFIYNERDSPFEREERDEGKGLKDAILGSVTLMTCPRMTNDPRWRLELGASGTKTQIRRAQYLHSDHYYLRVIPRLTEECRHRRRYKLNVARNYEIMPPLQELPGVYDFRIHPGNNCIVIDVVADLRDGEAKPYAPPHLQVDYERIEFTAWLRDD